MPAAVNCLLQHQVFIWGAFWVVADAFAVYDVNKNAMNSRMPFAGNKEGVNQHLASDDIGRYPSDVGRTSCPEDYSPCFCQLLESGLEVNCDHVSVEEIQDVFNRTETVELQKVYLRPSVPSSGAIHLPANLLSDKRAKKIILEGVHDFVSFTSPILTLEPATFRSTRLTTTNFFISSWDLASQTDMQFLNDFSVLYTFGMEWVNITECLSTLPTATLPALKELFFWQCTGLENAVFPELTPTKLVTLRLEDNFLDDATVNDILASIGSSSSASSLEALHLNSNFLTATPSTAAFPKLNCLEIAYISTISFINESRLVFSAPVRLLLFHYNNISSIEASAFQLGDYSADAQISLYANQLTEFREDVFLSVLQQMAGTAGSVNVGRNPFDCGCGLAWLIRDNPALIQNVQGGVCDGVFKFEDLDPASYVNCP